MSGLNPAKAALIIVALLSPGAFTLAQQAPGERSVSAFLRISRGDGDMPMNHDWLNQIIVSDGVFGSACREVLKRDPGSDEFKFYFTRAADASDKAEASWNPMQVFARMTISTDRGETSVDQLREIAKRTGSRFETAIDRLTGGERDRMARDADRLETRYREAREQVAKLEAEQREIMALAGPECSSSDAMRKVVEDFRTQKHALDLQLIGHKARAAALTQRIAELADAVKRAGESDPIAQELRQVLEAKQSALAAAKQMMEAGQSNERELQQRMADVAVARAEILRARNSAGAGLQEQLAALNSDLLSLSVDAAEAEARRAYVESRLAEIRKMNLVELAARADAVSRRLDQLRDAAAMMERDLRGATEAVERFNRARVELIGLE